MDLKSILPDRWTVVELTGAGLLGGGVWAQWGASWACIVWGALLLIVATIAARLSAPARTEE